MRKFYSDYTPRSAVERDFLKEAADEAMWRRREEAAMALEDFRNFHPDGFEAL